MIFAGKAQCEENCYLSEDDGNGDICRGYCRNAGHPVPIWICMGECLLICHCFITNADFPLQGSWPN